MNDIKFIICLLESTMMFLLKLTQENNILLKLILEYPRNILANGN